jgi:hypothetical protein
VPSSHEWRTFGIGVGVLLIILGLAVGISSLSNDYPSLAVAAFVVAVGGILLLLVSVRGVRARSSALKQSAVRKGQVLATSKGASSRPQVALVLDDDRLLWGGRALSASAVDEIERLDRDGQLRWHDGQYRDAMRGALRSAGYSPSPIVAERLEKAKKQVEAGRLKAAVGTLWEVEPDARQGDQGAARAIVELAGAIRERADEKLGAECSELIARASKAMEPTAPSSYAAATSTTRGEPNTGLQIAGGVVFVVGVMLIIGNVSGLAITFAYAGFLTTTVGALLFGAGRGKGE